MMMMMMTMHGWMDAPKLIKALIKSIFSSSLNLTDSFESTVTGYFGSMHFNPSFEDSLKLKSQRATSPIRKKTCHFPFWGLSGKKT